jgi:NADH-quinone oxidoreductase subunit N
VTASNFDPTTIRAIAPQIGLFILAAMIFILDLVWRGDKRRRLAWITSIGLVLVSAAMLYFAQPSVKGELVFGSMLRWDWFGFTFNMIFLFGGMITALLMKNHPEAGNKGEFYFLMVISILGMTMMASSADLIMLFLALETTSIPLYILAGFLRRDAKSTEAGFKYLLYGAMTSAMMLYGFSLLYGFTGTTKIYEIAAMLVSRQVALGPVAGVIILILVGIGFKISAVPFHFWAPDVYEGAPSPVTGFLSTASKAAGFSVLIRLLLGAFPDSASVWGIIISVLAVASMTFGNLQALNQKNIKRLLAYSSIAQAGYILIGVAAMSFLGTSGVVFYLIAYLVTNLAAFTIVTIIGKTLGSDEIKDYAGLSRRSPALSLGLLAAFLSLGGIPPFAGFVGKVLLFTSAIQVNMAWLAIIGIINSIIALYYYLVVLKVVYLNRSEGDETGLQISGSAKTAFAVCVIGILLVGILFAPWFNLSQMAVASIF